MSWKSQGGIPTPPSMLRSSLSSRRRRAEASSSSDEDAVKWFGISNVEFRVGAPPLRIVPLVTKYQDNDCARIESQFGTEFTDHARQILLEHGIEEPHEVSLCARMIPAEPCSALPTIFIIADWHASSSPYVWERIVKASKTYVDSRMSTLDGFRDLEITVEMVVPEFTLPKYISPIPRDANFPKLLADWPEIKARVIKILEGAGTISQHLTAIALFRLGYDEHHTTNPQTVYVSVDYSSVQLHWPSAVRNVQSYLDGLPHKLKFHIEHNVPKHYTFALLPETTGLGKFDHTPDSEYKTQVGIGSDIGSSLYLTRDDGATRNPGFGTLGCYLEVKTIHQPDWFIVALTNYHVVRPAFDGFQLGTRRVEAEKANTSTVKAPRDESDLLRADHKGFFPNDIMPRAALEHPSRLKHNFAVARAQNTLEGYHKPPKSFKENLDKKITFFDQGKHIFAATWIGSGYGRRTKTGGRLDWALLKPIDMSRVAGNRLPGEDFWNKLSTAEDYPHSLEKILEPPPTETGANVKHLEPVYKVGASTGGTIGYFNEFTIGCVLREEEHMGLTMSDEYSYIGYSNGGPSAKAFTDLGDSGSVAFDRDGRLLGLLFSGQAPNQCDQKSGTCYITPIEDVFQDIKKLTQGTVTDVRVYQGDRKRTRH